MPCRFASCGTVATSRSASRAILALNGASNFLRDLVISVLHRLRQSRTLHTLTFGPISGVHFRGRQHLRKHRVFEPIGKMLRQHAQRERSFRPQRYLAHSVVSHLPRVAPMLFFKGWAPQNTSLV